MTPGGSLAFRFEELCREDGTSLAIVTPTESLSRSEVDNRSAAIAAELTMSGAQFAEPIGMAVARGRDQILAMLAIVRMGCVCVPLDLDMPPARQLFVLRNSRCTRVLGSGPRPAHLIDVDWYDVLTMRSTASSAGADWRQHRPEGTDLACLLHTSGSTGTPKGVALEHGGLELVCAATAAILKALGVTRLYRFFAPSFDAATWETFIGLCNGVTLFIDPAGPRGMAPEQLVAMLVEHGVDCLITTPTFLMGLPPDEIRLPANLVVCGEVVAPALADRILRHATLLNAYGPCEISVCATIGRVSANERPVGIGRPLPHVGLELHGPDGGLVARGEVGEIVLTGPAVASGYRGASPEDDARFETRSTPHGKQLRTYRTGDLGRQRESGDYEFVGRKDNQLKIRGYRIEPEEIEIIIGRLEGVAGVIVAPAGEGEQRHLVAFVRANGSWTAEALIARSRSLLPRHMVPHRVEIVDELPQLPTGKADRAQLARIAEAMAKNSDTDTGAVSEPDSSALRSAWARALNIRAIDDNSHFFALGGDSLAAAQIIAAMDAAGVKLSLRDVYDNPEFQNMRRLVERRASK